MSVASAVVMAFAIVTQDQSALRAAPKESAQQQAVLWQGDSLEVRGERMGYLQVYDHRRERAGYIRATQVRTPSLKAADAPDLLAVVRFLRDTPGSEALGISYTAAYLKAAPAEAIDAEAFDALGTMAERLARRASVQQSSQPNDAKLAAHLEVAKSYGVAMQSFERDGQMQLCYNGEAFRRVLALKSNDEKRARAALALTRQECVDPNLRPVERNGLDVWRAQVLDRVELANLPEFTKNRLHVRRAGVWSSIAFQRSRKGEAGQEAVQEAAKRALMELAAVNKVELAEEDAVAYTEAAVRVGASRWAAEPEQTPGAGLHVVTSKGEPGETCIGLRDGKQGEKEPDLVRRCTYGVVWAASASANAQGTALALAVQPLDTWREMWVFQKGSGGWRVDVVVPGLNGVDLGYVEFAGWVPGTAKMLVAREVKTDGRFKRSFELMGLETLAVEKWADSPERLGLFAKWQDARWKGGTVSVR